MITQQVLQGDCRQILKTLADNSVHCIVTSPPYWGQRSYLPADHPLKGFEIGCELKLAIYIAHMVEVFREARRVLRKDGTLWLNLGDKAATDTKWGGGKTNAGKNQRSFDGGYRTLKLQSGLSDKNLIGLPWRVAFALQEDGWILRQDIIWNKLNPMPESITDRPTKSHEYIFLFSKSKHYYYDQEAVKEPVTGGAHSRGKGQNPKRLGADEYVRANARFNTPVMVETRNKRSVWTIANQPYFESHFATFPEKLIEPCIQTTPSQTCEHCGAGWIRVVEKGELVKTGKGGSRKATELIVERRGESSTETSCFSTGALRQTKTVGWRPGCKCEGNTGAGRAIMLDPFGGSGTVGQVATRFGRDAILIELNPEYIRQIEKRTDEVQMQWVV